MLIRTPEGDQLVCNVAERVVAYEPRTGKEIWSVKQGNNYWITEGQIRWIREHEMGRAALPSKAGMLAEIAERKAWVMRYFKDSPRHGIEVEHMPYFADLRRSLRDAQRRAGSDLRDVGIGAERPTVVEPVRVAAE